MTNVQKIQKLGLCLLLFPCIAGAQAKPTRAQYLNCLESFVAPDLNRRVSRGELGLTSLGEKALVLSDLKTKSGAPLTVKQALKRGRVGDEDKKRIGDGLLVTSLAFLEDKIFKLEYDPTTEFGIRAVASAELFRSDTPTAVFTMFAVAGDLVMSTVSLAKLPVANAQDTFLLQYFIGSPCEDAFKCVIAYGGRIEARRGQWPTKSIDPVVSEIPESDTILSLLRDTTIDSLEILVESFQSVFKSGWTLGPTGVDRGIFEESDQAVLNVIRNCGAIRDFKPVSDAIQGRRDWLKDQISKADQ